MLIRNVLQSFAFATLALASPIQNPTSLPTVDLGYGIYRASYYNETYDAYVFSNIRFAAPPIGALRFSPPQPPAVDRTKIHDGSEGLSCPAALTAYPILPPGYDPPQGEDCLFLDVIVPRKVLSGSVGKVPVAFWLFGGAFTMGTKTAFGDPIVFLKDSPSPVVWVAINYRLGHLGFLTGPAVTLTKGATPNAGLHDQRFGLQWVQDNIHLFGGNKNEVTMMGISAGAGSAIHQLTAYGGKDAPPMFKRILAFSGGFLPHASHADGNDEYTTFEAAVGCAGKGLSCIRAAPTEILMKANRAIITGLQLPRPGPGPAVDGDLVPDLPANLLAQGRFHKNITVITIDDFDEGSMFMNASRGFTAPQAVDDYFPHISATSRAELLALYPPPSSTTSYTTELARFSQIWSDAGFNCNRYALSIAMPDHTYNGKTAGQHGTGANVVFQGAAAGPGYTPELVDAMRRFVMNFVITGNPNQAGKGVIDGVSWPVYGKGKGVIIDGTTMKVVDTTATDPELAWWGKGLTLS